MFLLHKITFLFTLNNKHCCLLQMHDDDADVTTKKIVIKCYLWWLPW